MTVASMSSTEYVSPAVFKDDVYISGDNVAKSPALFSYLFTKQRINDSNIRVISIGSIDEEPNENQLVQYSLYDWFYYLLTDNHNIVQHTMDYMLAAMAEKNGDKYHKFELHRNQ